MTTFLLVLWLSLSVAGTILLVALLRADNKRMEGLFGWVAKLNGKTK